MMKDFRSKPLLLLAFLTATACTIHIAENLIFRALPLPFIRLGLSNVIILLLITNGYFGYAIGVNILKSLIGGIFTFTLMSPATILSLSGGLCAALVMYILLKSRMGFSLIGISVGGAIVHNLVQITIVRHLIIKTDAVYNLLPVLMLLGLISGLLIAYLTSLFTKQMGESFINGELQI